MGWGLGWLGGGFGGSGGQPHSLLVYRRAERREGLKKIEKRAVECHRCQCSWPLLTISLSWIPEMKSEMTGIPTKSQPDTLLQKQELVTPLLSGDLFYYYYFYEEEEQEEMETKELGQ